MAEHPECFDGAQLRHQRVAVARDQHQAWDRSHAEVRGSPREVVEVRRPRVINTRRKPVEIRTRPEVLWHDLDVPRIPPDDSLQLLPRQSAPAPTPAVLVRALDDRGLKATSEVVASLPCRPNCHRATLLSDRVVEAP